jgi:hypothetical protein
MLEDSLRVLEAIETIDTVSDHACPLEQRPVEYILVHRMVMQKPIVYKSVEAPAEPLPLRAKHRAMVDQVAALLQPDGTYFTVRKKPGKRWLEKPEAIQKQLERDRDLLVPVFIVAAAQKLKRAG